MSYPTAANAVDDGRLNSADQDVPDQGELGLDMEGLHIETPAGVAWGGPFAMHLSGMDADLGGMQDVHMAGATASPRQDGERVGVVNTSHNPRPPRYSVSTNEDRRKFMDEYESYMFAMSMSTSRELAVPRGVSSHQPFLLQEGAQYGDGARLVQLLLGSSWHPM